MLKTASPRSGRAGFTLIELAMIIVILGILASVAVPRFADIAEGSKLNATRQEMHTLKEAIIGNPSVVSGGTYIDRGFEGDVGFIPSLLSDLAAKPDSIKAYNRLTRLGWNGPYIDSSGANYLTDAWGNPYIYEPGNRRIISTGNGSDSLILTF